MLLKKLDGLDNQIGYDLVPDYRAVDNFSGVEFLQLKYLAMRLQRNRFLNFMNGDKNYYQKDICYKLVLYQ